MAPRKDRSRYTLPGGKNWTLSNAHEYYVELHPKDEKPMLFRQGLVNDQGERIEIIPYTPGETEKEKIV